jgi:hypothetical protein
MSLLRQRHPGTGAYVAATPPPLMTSTGPGGRIRVRVGEAFGQEHQPLPAEVQPGE